MLGWRGEEREEEGREGRETVEVCAGRGEQGGRINDVCMGGKGREGEKDSGRWRCEGE